MVLPPRRPTRLGHDRRNHVDQLSETSGMHPVGVLQQTDEQAADHHRIGHRVLILQQPRRGRPIVQAGNFSALLVAVLVPDIPLIEGDGDAPHTAPRRLHPVCGSGDRLDEGLHVHSRSQKAAPITVRLLVIGVAGNEVHVLVAVLQHHTFPRPERRHRPAGAAADHKLQARIQLPHRPGHLACDLAVIIGAAMADLPRPIHLIAEAPHSHPERLR
jgi:hypothetical protein